VTVEIASSVDNSFRNPYWFVESPHAAAIAVLSLAAITFSKADGSLREGFGRVLALVALYGIPSGPDFFLVLRLLAAARILGYVTGRKWSALDTSPLVLICQVGMVSSNFAAILSAAAFAQFAWSTVR